LGGQTLPDARTCAGGVAFRVSFGPKHTDLRRCSVPILPESLLE